VLAPFILMTQLLPRISQRIVNVSSISAAGSLDWSGLDAKMHGKIFSAHSAYSLSKLAVQMFTAELAERAPQLPSTLCLDPGTVNTKMLLAGWGPCGIEVCSVSQLNSMVYNIIILPLYSYRRVTNTKQKRR
jgi:NAD(P)-dependent dehydrogenase (short-subunit alcohol dehydrogenase family)